MVGGLTTRVRDAFQKGNNSCCDLILALSRGDERREGFKETDVGGGGARPSLSHTLTVLAIRVIVKVGTEEPKTWTGYLPK